MVKPKKKKKKLDKKPENIFKEDISNTRDKLTKIINKKSYFFLGYLLLFIAIPFLLSIFNYQYLEDRSMWRFSINEISIGGLTYKEAYSKMEQAHNQYLDKKITFSIDENLYSISVRKIGLEFDIDSELQDVFITGHDDTVIENYKTRIRSIFKDKEHPIYVTLNQKTLNKTLTSYIHELEAPPINATISVYNNNFVIEDPHDGLTIDFDKISKEILSNANDLKLPFIKTNTYKASPDISYQDAVDAKKQAQELRSKEFILVSKTPDKKFNIKLIENLDLIRISHIFNPLSNKDELVVDISPEKLFVYIEDIISKEIYRLKEDTILDVNEDLIITADGLLVDGYNLNLLESTRKLREDFISQDSFSEIEVIVDIDTAEIIQPEDINLGINEVIAYGSSNYTGSPQNRRHNIKIAMRRFQNIILMPGDEFSFNKVLGPVTAETGYKKELVIKEGGNLTIPEYGGGVCQVSTTLFRAALYAGLDITNRRSHSYKVRYYNPDGLDATIYPPTVDFKFKNNFESPILIQNKLDEENSIANFYIYGTKDSRDVQLDGPHRYAYKQKPEGVITQYVPSLPEWWRKETNGHSGFNVYWIRKIEKENTEPEEEYFYSYYKAVSDKIQIGGNPPPEPVIPIAEETL